MKPPNWEIIMEAALAEDAKARQAAPDESREGRLGDYLSLYFSNWFSI